MQSPYAKAEGDVHVSRMNFQSISNRNVRGFRMREHKFIPRINKEKSALSFKMRLGSEHISAQLVCE
jgi:hypothetical protein